MGKAAAYLVLCHRPPRYAAELARRTPEARFYVHYDTKSPLGELDFLRPINNITVLDERVNVRWAGFSMVAATLLLLRAALAEADNGQFHLMSGDCVLLCSPAAIVAEFAKLPENALLLESRPTLRLRHRARFSAPHADTGWQRSLAGKVLTKCIQAADLLLPTRQLYYAGSQWFSARRAAAEALLAAADGGMAEVFRHKLCPDEHFFQAIAARYPDRFSHFAGNRRYIRFAARSNHPDWLGAADLRQAAAEGNWFARKADDAVALAFLHDLPHPNNE